MLIQCKDRRAEKRQEAPQPLQPIEIKKARRSFLKLTKRLHTLLGHVVRDIERKTTERDGERTELIIV